MPPSVTFVLEWENALLAEMARPIEMLNRLSRQVIDYAAGNKTRFELLIVFNSEDVSPEFVDGVIADHVDEKKWPGKIRKASAVGLHYYDLKNFGAQKAVSDIVLFLDSDVIPDDNWLPALLDVFDDPDIQFVAGNTYMAPDGFLGKCFALTWNFPAKEDKPDLFTQGGFYANNIAFRREFFLANPFPSEDCYRGQCGQLASNLSQKGYLTHVSGRAWVSHPAPNGLEHYIVRAIAKGYDNQYWSTRRHAGGWLAKPVGTVRRFAVGCAKVLINTVKRYPKVKVGFGYLIVAIPVGLTYQLIVLGSELFCYARPQAIRRRFSI